ncbi:MAG TPA: hypothetical protein VFD19_01545, partial [Clostridia bacterium]|nr:hypothetical protein [Clostridia bacterium]
GGSSLMRKYIFLLFIAMTLTVAVACGSRSFDAKGLASLDLTGANGFGSLVVNLDGDRLNALIQEESSTLSETDEQGLKQLFAREAAINSLIFVADKTANLKNGDEVAIRANYDEALAKSAGVRFQNLKFKYVIDGLQEASPIDVKRHVDLTFSGFDGKGVATLSLSGDVERYRSGFDFIFTDEKVDLSNGNLVEVKVVPNNNVLIGHGKIALQTTLSFEVKGLPSLDSIDLFTNLILVFDGVSDHGVVSFDTTRLPVEWVEVDSLGQTPLQFSATPSSDLANGDSIRVQAFIDEGWFAERGMKAGQVTKGYTVHGLKEYPRNLDKVDLMPLFDKIAVELEKDLGNRLDQNYWNADYRPGDPVSRWQYTKQDGVNRIYYGYEQANRARNFVALFYKVTIDGKCQEITPYQSAYLVGDQKSATLYFVYVVEGVMYDRSDIDDFREFNLKLHSDVELEAVARFKNQYGGVGIQIVDVRVPEEVRYTESLVP